MTLSAGSINVTAKSEFNNKDLPSSPARQALNLNQTKSETDSTENLKKALMDEAQKVLDEKNAVLTPDSEKILTNLINSAAKRLRRDKATEKTLEKAKLNVRKFTLAMVENGKAKRTPRGEITRGGSAPTSYYDRQVDAKAVKAAKGICPLYPICN